MKSRKITVATMGPALAVAIAGAASIAPAAPDGDEREAEAIVTGYLSEMASERELDAPSRSEQDKVDFAAVGAEVIRGPVEQSRLEAE